MNEQTTVSSERQDRFSQVLERFTRLTQDGRRHFIGRLIGDAAEKPSLKTEIERALQRLETDFHLRKCWMNETPHGERGIAAISSFGE